MIDSHSNYQSQEDRITTNNVNSPNESAPKHGVSAYDHRQKDFFEALGLPGDLSRQSMRHFNYCPPDTTENSRLGAYQNKPPTYLESPLMDARSQFMNPSTQQ